MSTRSRNLSPDTPRRRGSFCPPHVQYGRRGGYKRGRSTYYRTHRRGVFHCEYGRRTGKDFDSFLN